MRLDYLFLPSRYGSKLVSCEIMDVPGAREASDHLPLLSVLDAPPAPLASATVTSVIDAGVALTAVELEP